MLDYDSGYRCRLGDPQRLVRPGLVIVDGSWCDAEDSRHLVFRTAEADEPNYFALTGRQVADLFFHGTRHGDGPGVFTLGASRFPKLIAYCNPRMR
jgi:hypothetical protein